MKPEAKYEFRKKLLTVHEPHRRNSLLKPQANQIELKDRLKIYVDTDDIVATTSAEDFTDYLKTSMDLSSSITEDEESAFIRLYLAEDKNIDLKECKGYKGFLIDASTDKIDIYANDVRGIAQALYYLEDVMNMECAPFIPRGETRKKPMFAPRMTHSGYGLDDFPDAYLSRIAHEGFDAILLFVKGFNLSLAGPCDFNDLVERCKKYGLDVYMYSGLSSQKHPDDIDAENYYESTYGEIFKRCPDIKGIILVGESIFFPSKDPNLIRDKRTYKYFKPLNLTSSGYPCCDYPKLISMIKKVVNKYNSDTDIVFWTYNWGYHDKEARIKLINSLPEGITLQATFEMFEPVKTGSITADYTISFEGPGEYFKSEAEAAFKKGIKLYSMTNTGGLTWDFGVIPYEPVPYQWIKRYKAMRKAHADWGLSGIMESHHYGWYPSFVSKLAKWSFWEDTTDFSGILEKIISSEFGKENCDSILKALDHLSKAITYYPPSTENQYGAFRVGTAYPLNTARRYDLPRDSESKYKIWHDDHSDGCDHRFELLNFRIDKEIKNLTTMHSLVKKAVDILVSLNGKNEKLDNFINLVRYWECCVISGINFKKWYVARCKFYAESSRKKVRKYLDTMKAILREERENATNSLEFIDNDSRLGWEPTMLYIASRDNVEWKIEQTHRIENLDLHNFYEAINNF